MKKTTLYLLRLINFPFGKVRVARLLFVTGIFVTATGLHSAEAQNWLKANGNLYTLPIVKIGIGTASPTRNLEMNAATDNFLRINSIGGTQLENQTAGIELRRSLWNGTNVIWSINNESTFRIRQNGVPLFTLTPSIARIGEGVDDPLEFVVYGKSITQTGGSLISGALTLNSKTGAQLRTIRIDGDQLESTHNFSINTISDADVTLTSGGGKVRIGAVGNEAKLNVASTNDMHLKLTNPGTGGADWRVGVANDSWQAGAGKLVFSHTASSQDATLVLTTAGKVGIGLTTPSRELQVNGTIRTNILEIIGGADLAEPFKIAEAASIDPGTVVSIDPENPGQLRMASQAYDKTVAGIISGAGEVRPGMIMGQEGTLADGDHPVALSGRVYVKADASFGAIEPGDLLTTSNRAGYAMKVKDHQKAQGAIIGKAMTRLEEGDGLVLVLVSLQ